MLNFIIYEDDVVTQKEYVQVITKFVMNKDIQYQTIRFEKYTRETMSKIKDLDGKKIFVIDIEVPGKSGLEFAREIRDSGDWVSPIIICSSHKELKNTGFASRLLMLDFIAKDDEILKNLEKSLKVAFDIIDCHKSYNFRYSGEYYQVPYESILYIEKNLNDNYATLYTKRSNYVIKDSIINIFSILNDPRFLKSSRSCIVNTDNISSIDFINNIINFGELSTDLISREGKKALRNFIKE